MPSSSYSILNNSGPKRIMRLKDGEVVRRTLAVGESKVDDVAGDKREVIWCEANG
jgi:hypothetical protein